MYTRRKSSTGCLRWIVGLALIVGAVGGFLAYQSAQPLSAPTTALTNTPSSAPKNPISAQPTTAPRATLRVVAEKAGLTAPIIELYYSSDDGWDVAYLNQYAGHLQGTPTVGQGGNVVLAGHVEMKDGTAGPFAGLHLLKAGDPIAILSDDPGQPMVMQYTVISVRAVDPNAINEIRSHGYEELTLVTCQDWDAKAKTYQKRIVIHARPVTKAAPTSALVVLPKR